MIIIRCWMIFIYSLTLPDPSQIIVFVGLCVASWDTVKCPNYGRTIYYQDTVARIPPLLYFLKFHLMAKIFVFFCFSKMEFCLNLVTG